jgi:DUF1365 family protein
MHHRFAPKVHHFQHDLFMFYLDLDELEPLSKNLWLFSHNRRNVYRLNDGDHEPAGSGTLKERLHHFLRQNGLAAELKGRVMLLTLPRICGYIFNPISIYYCFDAAGAPLATVVEVGNTFREMKLYLLRAEDLAAGGRFEKIVPKHFYVSPFSSLELNFDFRLRIPGEKLDIKVDDRDGTEKVMISTLTGFRAELSDRNLVWFSLKYPLVTVKVIFLIHWHAFRLWAKGVPFIRKAANVSLQREVLRPHPTLAPKTK